jgi:hypothetical protein
MVDVGRERKAEGDACMGQVTATPERLSTNRDISRSRVETAKVDNVVVSLSNSVELAVCVNRKRPQTSPAVQIETE